MLPWEIGSSSTDISKSFPVMPQLAERNGSLCICGYVGVLYWDTVVIWLGKRFPSRIDEGLDSSTYGQYCTPTPGFNSYAGCIYGVLL